jgi:hypothetical protein
MHNEADAQNPAMTLPFRIGCPGRGVCGLRRSPKIRTMRHLVAIATAVILGGLGLHPADQTYEQRFAYLLAGVLGFVSDPGLVDTNGPGLVVGPKPLPFSGFSRAGELAAVRLGMTMSQVVAAWGKPRALFTRCGIGPRFYYGHEVSLFFREERLVRIVLYGPLRRAAVFDNGLKGTMGSTPVEALIGTSLARATRDVRTDDSWLAYVSGGLHMDLSFHHVPTTPPSAWQAEELECIIVECGDRNTRVVPGEQSAAPNAAPPHR